MNLSDLVKFQPRQQQALKKVLEHDFVLYGGAAGGGKSYWLRWCSIFMLLYWGGQGVKNARVGLFSLDYPTLADRQLVKIRAEVPDWLGTFHEQARELRLRRDWGGGVLCFRNLDDPGKYKSAEFAAIGVEELTENEEQVFHDLRWRLRWPGIERPKFFAATNPGGIGHSWVKRHWLTGDLAPELEPKRDQFSYVPAKAQDNSYLPASYIANLSSLPPAMRAALLDGSWDVFSGQVFSEFRRDVHTCAPFKIPSWWDVWMSNDPGYSDDGVWHWFASDGDGNVYVIREMDFKKIAHSEQAKQVWDVQKKINSKTNGEQEPGYCVTGMDAYREDPNNNNKCLVDYYRKSMNMGFRRPVHGSGARAAQAATLHEYLRVFDHPESGKPTAKLHIFTEGEIDGIKYGCPKLIETLPALVSDPNDPEAIQECSIDHWYQCAAYGLQSRHADNAKAPKKKYPPNSAYKILGLEKVFGEDDE